MFHDENMWDSGYSSKDEEMASLFDRHHPLFHLRDRLRDWLCTELVGKHPESSDAPKWMTKEFKARMLVIFTWGGDEALQEGKIGRLEQSDSNISPTL